MFFLHEHDYGPALSLNKGCNFLPRYRDGARQASGAAGGQNMPGISTSHVAHVSTSACSASWP
eukprot:scaffold295554_cov31-Tisochrysis_lutea.AAC.3